MERDRESRPSLQERYAAYIGHDRPGHWFGTRSWYLAEAKRYMRVMFWENDSVKYPFIWSVIIMVLAFVYVLIWE